jgi:hypothetical protein
MVTPTVLPVVLPVSAMWSLPYSACRGEVGRRGVAEAERRALGLEVDALGRDDGERGARAADVET